MTIPSKNELMIAYYYFIPEPLKQAMRKCKTLKDNILRDRRVFSDCYVRAVCLNCLSQVSYCVKELPILDGRINVTGTNSFWRIPLVKYLRLKNYMVMNFTENQWEEIKPDRLIGIDMLIQENIDFSYRLETKILPKFSMTTKFLKDICWTEDYYPDFSLNPEIKVRYLAQNYLEDLTSQRVNLEHTDIWYRAFTMNNPKCKKSGHLVFNSKSDKERRCRRCRIVFPVNSTHQMLRCRRLADTFRFCQNEKIFF